MSGDANNAESIRTLLAEVEQALDDWLVTYASDCFSEEQVRSAFQRLMDEGGTISYVTDLRERVHAALNDKEAS